MMEEVKRSDDSIHVIRLRRPWVKTVDDREPVERADVPDTINDTAESAGVRVQYRRPFNCPSGLGKQRVRLRVTGWHGNLKGLRLNGTEVHVDSSASSVDADITALLKPHNELALVLMGTSEVEPSLSGEVMLAILASID